MRVYFAPVGAAPVRRGLGDAESPKLIPARTAVVQLPPMTQEQDLIPVYNSDGSLAGYADDHDARQLIRARLGRISRKHNRGSRCIELRVAVSEAVSYDGGRLQKAISLQDLSRGQRFVYRAPVGQAGDGLFTFTLKDQPGVGIRLRCEPVRMSETQPAEESLIGRFSAAFRSLVPGLPG